VCFYRYPLGALRIIMSRLLKSIYRNVRFVIYSLGKQKKCPICNASFIKFLSAGSKSHALVKYQVDGAGYRENVTCLSCSSSDRSRLLYLFLTLKHESLLNSPINLLHVASDTEFPSFFKSKKNISYFNGDLDKNLGDLELDITAMSFESNFFDLIICNHVIEQIEDELSATKELFRVLKKNGFAILQAPVSRVRNETYEDLNLNTPEQYESAYGQKDMRRMYGQDYKKRLELAGFMMQELKPNNFLSMELITRHGINPNENIFIGYK
jgi:SAM-dependent methyltransferase